MDSDRFELKYWVPYKHLPALVRQISPFMRMDSYANPEKGPQQGYWVYSLYFDNIHLEAYHDKLAGLQHRSKLRLRTYGTSDSPSALYLEVKEKSGMTIRKHRSPLPSHYLKQPPPGGWVQHLRRLSFETNTGQSDALQRKVHTPNLRPTVLVVYRRIPYVAVGAERVRITFDHSVCARRASHLQATLDEHPLRPTLGNGVILEIKFSGAMPLWLQSFIVRNELVRESISKYTIGMEAVSPLTENRRHRAFVDEGLDDLAISLLGRSPQTRRYS